MADSDPRALKDRHPELSAPILNLSLEARITRAEQAVVDRDAHVRGDALRIVDTLRSKRGVAMRWAGIAGAAAAAGYVGYVGYRAWRERKSASTDGSRPAERPKATSFASEIAVIARVATQWALKLHREQGVSGSLFGMMRGALWPSASMTPPAAGPAARQSGVAGGFADGA